MNPSPNAYQSTPSWRPTFSSPTFQSPLLTNWTTATFQSRATARNITPNAAELFPLPLPVLTSTSEGAERSPSGRGSSASGSVVMAFGAYARACSVSPRRRTQRSPVRSRRCPATVVPSPDGRARSPGQTREYQTLEARAVRRSIRPQTHLVLQSTRRNRWLLRSKRRNVPCAPRRWSASSPASHCSSRPVATTATTTSQRRRRRRRSTVTSEPAATSPDHGGVNARHRTRRPRHDGGADRPGPVEDHLACHRRRPRCCSRSVPVTR